LLLKVSRVLETRPYLPDEYLRGKKISSKVDGVDTYSYRYAAKLRIDYKTFLIRIFESYFLPFQLWNRIVRAGHWPACLRQEHPFLRDQIENSEQKPGYTRCESCKVCVALYQPLMHLGWLCASSKAKERPEMIKVYISYVFGIASSSGFLYSLWCSYQTEYMCTV
jgi:interleukin-1 receptor-associated kinase 1